MTIKSPIFNSEIEQMDTKTPAHANEFNKRFNQLSENDKYLNENKVDKVQGKGLSDENYSKADKNKLDGIEIGANKYTHSTSHPASMITGLHDIATSGNYNDLINKPVISYPVTSINSKTGAVTLTADDIKCKNGQSVTFSLDDKASKNHTHDMGAPLEISQWIDFHNSGSKADYDARFFWSGSDFYKDIPRVGSFKILDQRDYDQLFQFASDKNRKIASAVTDMGVPTDAKDNGDTVASNIRKISSKITYNSNYSFEKIAEINKDYVYTFVRSSKQIKKYDHKGNLLTVKTVENNGRFVGASGSYYGCHFNDGNHNSYFDMNDTLIYEDASGDISSSITNTIFIPPNTVVTSSGDSGNRNMIIYKDGVDVDCGYNNRLTEIFININNKIVGVGDKSCYADLSSNSVAIINGALAFCY